MNAIFLRDDQDDWNDVAAMTCSGVPAARVGIQINPTKRVRFDVPRDAGQSVFQDVRCVDATVFVGFRESLFVIRPLEQAWGRIQLEDYFGYVYTPEDFGLPVSSFGVLVASGSTLFNLTNTGTLIWCARDLAVDGVQVSNVRDGLIFGSAEGESWNNPTGIWLLDLRDTMPARCGTDIIQTRPILKV
jgi:hypothetical protein